MTSKLFRSTALLSVVLLFTGCAAFKKKNGAGGYGGSDSDNVNGTPLPDREDGVSFMSDNVDKHQFAPVHFAYDSYAVDAGDEATLQQVAQFLQGGGGKKIIVAGFTDERGTPEYNRGLGERRAGTVRDYLIGHGANAELIQTVSFGAEMPADPGSGEEAWAKNRRAEFGVVK